MLYMKTTEGKLRIIVLETPNLDDLRKGILLQSPDDSVLLAWSPDPDWLAEAFGKTDGSVKQIVEAIAEAWKRPQAPPRLLHELIRKQIGGTNSGPDNQPTGG